MVIVVIGILAAIIAVSYVGIQQKAVVATLQADLKNSSTQLEIDKTNGTDKYPSSAAAANNGLGLKSSPGITYTYVYTSGDNSYCLAATYTSGVSYYITSINKVPAAGTCAPAGIDTFARAWGGTAEDYGNSITATSDGGYAVTGFVSSFGGGSSDMFIAKYTSAGVLSWNKTWGGADSDYGNTIIQTSDGGYAVAGYTDSYAIGAYDMFIAKYTSAGTLSWSKVWGGGSGHGKSLVQTSDGGYIVTGATGNYGAGNYDMFIVKYTSDGTLSWNKTWGGTGYDEGMSVIQTSDGGYAVTGYTSNLGNEDDMFIVKYTSTGVVSWNKTWGDSLYYDMGYDIVQTSDDGYAVTGSTGSYGVDNEDDIFIAKYTSGGALSWSKTWGDVGYDYGSSIVQTVDGGYVIAGGASDLGLGVSSEAAILKYMSDGTLSWAKTFGGTGNNCAYSLVQSTDGGYVMVGQTNGYGAGDVDLLFVKFDSSGSVSGCSSPMCQSPSFTVTAPTAATTTPSATVTTPSAGVSSPTASTTTPSATVTTIVE